jgi:hypothetical protein
MAPLIDDTAKQAMMQAIEAARYQGGTNDKAGNMRNLLRWTSVRTIKENFVPPS